MPRDRAMLVTIYWRDVPAQVNAQVGRERHQVLLPNRFQRAIDRSKRKAKIYTSAEDIAEWRRETKPFSGDPVAAVQAEIDTIVAAYDADRLRRIIYSGGWETDVDEAELASVTAADLAALEELEEDE